MFQPIERHAPASAGLEYGAPTDSMLLAELPVRYPPLAGLDCEVLAAVIVAVSADDESPDMMSNPTSRPPSSSYCME